MSEKNTQLSPEEAYIEGKAVYHIAGGLAEGRGGDKNKPLAEDLKAASYDVDEQKALNPRLTKIVLEKLAEEQVLKEEMGVELYAKTKERISAIFDELSDIIESDAEDLKKRIEEMSEEERIEKSPEEIRKFGKDMMWWLERRVRGDEFLKAEFAGKEDLFDRIIKNCVEAAELVSHLVVANLEREINKNLPTVQ